MTTRSYGSGVIPEEILALSHERDLLRRRGQYTRADVLKRQLEDAGYRVKDNPRGAHLVILPSIQVDGKEYRTAHHLPSLLTETDLCDFSVLILAHNTSAQARRCVESVLRFAGSTNLEIILLDNASHDDTEVWSETLRLHETRLHVVRTSRTMGVAEAYNIGFKQSRGRYILLLNASVELTGDIFTALAHTLSSDDIGLTGPHGLRTEDLRHFEDSQEQEVEAIDGQCMAMKRTLLQQAGLFDERFRLPSYMDVDLSFALRDLGVNAAVTAQLPFINHADAHDTEVPDAESSRLTKRNFYHYLEKWGQRDDLLLDEEEEDDDEDE
ncbi:MAG TPA: glycosyltransferase [Ktedonobacteraceae bacterium]|nr:glycosyltransferase [Ktedonobacteraceae bacterium]